MTVFKIVEKKNNLAVHAHCSSRASAERYLNETTPQHVAKSYFIDKTLTSDSFEIREERNAMRPLDLSDLPKSCYSTVIAEGA